MVFFGVRGKGEKRTEGRGRDVVVCHYVTGLAETERFYRRVLRSFVRFYRIIWRRNVAHLNYAGLSHGGRTEEDDFDSVHRFRTDLDRRAVRLVLLLGFRILGASLQKIQIQLCNRFRIN